MVFERTRKIKCPEWGRDQGLSRVCDKARKGAALVEVAQPIVALSPISTTWVHLDLNQQNSWAHSSSQVIMMLAHVAESPALGTSKYSSVQI